MTTRLKQPRHPTVQQHQIQLPLPSASRDSIAQSPGCPARCSCATPPWRGTSDPRRLRLRRVCHPRQPAVSAPPYYRSTNLLGPSVISFEFDSSTTSLHDIFWPHFPNMRYPTPSVFCLLFLDLLHLLPHISSRGGIVTRVPTATYATAAATHYLHRLRLRVRALGVVQVVHQIITKSCRCIRGCRGL